MGGLVPTWMLKEARQSTKEWIGGTGNMAERPKTRPEQCGVLARMATGKALEDS